jgi:uncharacterized damage-inducible protein DinB
MATTLTDRYRRWFEYEQDSHARTLDSLLRVREEGRASPSFQKAVDLLAHIVAARWLWLFRLGVARRGPEDLFPRDVPVEDLAGRLAAVHAAWSAYLGSLDDDATKRRFEYRSTEGMPYRSTVEDILTQLFGHSWYHRGQIAALVRTLGAEPAATDFVFWTREPIEPT